MEKEIYEQILLKKIKKLEKAQYVIYGTKDVALIYYNEVVKKFGEDSIAFFIDGKKESDYFKDKPVYKCDEIIDKNINIYKYIIGSVTKIPLFINNLKKAGVKKENIIDTINCFSPDYIDANIAIIQNIYLYPQIESKEVLEEMIKVLDNYIIVPQESEQSVKIYATNSTNTPLPHGYKIIAGDVQLVEREDNDIVLVWDTKSLQNKELEGLEKVYCFDNKFSIHLSPKILSAVMRKFLQTKPEAYYQELSKSHFEELIHSCKNYNNAIVCGTGPSILKMDEEYKELLEESCVIVCNGFYCNKASLSRVKPKAYILQDNDWLTYNLRNQMDGIIDYVLRNEIYLCVSVRWISVCCTRYPLIEDRIIGFEDKEYNIFPSINELVYTNSNNVITSMCIPIASSLANNIFILGCDGVKNGKWTRAYNEEFKINSCKESFLQPVYGDSIIEYVKTLNMLYKNILEYGELKGKKYLLLAHSTIHEIEKRYCEYDEVKKYLSNLHQEKTEDLRQ